MHPPRLTSLVLICSAVLMGCDASPPPAAAQQTPTAQEATAPAAVDRSVAGATTSPRRPTQRFAVELRNARYPIDTTDDGHAQLVDGAYEASVDGSAGRNSVRLADAPAFGDLDGDRVEDAAVILLAGPGGSGSFSYVSAVLNENGAARPVGSVLLGDRISVQSIRIMDGRIDIGWLDRKPGDPMSAPPTTPVRKVFAVQGGALVAIGG